MDDATTVKGIKLEPNYDQLFATFEREAKLKAAGILAELPDGDVMPRSKRGFNLECLRAIQAVLVPINICAQCATSRETILRLRDVIDAVTTSIRTQADEIEEKIYEEDRREAFGRLRI